MNPRFAGILATLAAVGALISANWAWVEMMWAKPQVEAFVVSSLSGSAFSVIVPYLFPKWEDSERVKTYMRWGSVLITFAIAWRMIPTENGLVYAFLSACAGTFLLMRGTAMLYLIFPELKPGALKTATELTQGAKP